MLIDMDKFYKLKVDMVMWTPLTQNPPNVLR